MQYIDFSVSCSVQILFWLASSLPSLWRIVPLRLFSISLCFKLSFFQFLSLSSYSYSLVLFELCKGRPCKFRISVFFTSVRMTFIFDNIRTRFDNKTCKTWVLLSPGYLVTFTSIFVNLTSFVIKLTIEHDTL